MYTIGFIGLGAMGSRIADRFLDAGHRVYATNRTAAKAQPLIERGLIWLHTPREVAATADVVFSMVTDDAALEAITAGRDGLVAGLRPGQVYVDMSTVSPQASRGLAARVSALGAQMLDAPVSGSIPQAESGTLAILVGGDQQAFAAVQPLLRELGQTVTHIGASGQGLLLKLAINISLAVQTLAFSEGLLLAERAGVDPEVAAGAMSASSIGSPMLKARIPLLLHPPEHAWFDVGADAKGHPPRARRSGRPPDPAPLGHRRRPNPDQGTQPRLRTPRPRLAARSPRRNGSRNPGEPSSTTDP
jgi:3-hydroxyisobutyrate dehydrogenase-like beta-hydroxyacid dehydrogenase